MNFDRRSSIRTLALISAISAVNFAGSASRAPEENWEHLYEGSPLLIGSTEAWRLGSLTELEPRNVSFAKFYGPGREAILTAYPYKIDPSPGEEIPRFSDEDHPPLTFHVVDLSTGKVIKKFSLPYDSTLFMHGGGAENRLFHFETTLRPVFSDFNPPHVHSVFDSKTGKVFRFPDRIQRGHLESAIPHIACFRRLYDPDLPQMTQRPDPDLETFDLIDFSHQPPKHQVFVHKDSDFDVRMLDENLFLYHRQYTNGTGVKYWRAKLDTGQKFSLSKIDYERMEKQLGINQSNPKLSLEYRHPSAVHVECPPGGFRPSIRVADDMYSYDAQGDPPLFIFWSKGKAKLLKTTKANQKSAVAELTSYAKQRARAFALETAKSLQQFAASNGGTLPGSSAILIESASAKFKERVPLGKFVWTGLNGQKLGEIPSSPQFELGHLTGPGGRAVIFGDFRVEWRQDLWLLANVLWRKFNKKVLRL